MATTKYGDSPSIRPRTTVQRELVVWPAGVLIYDTDDETLYVGDGSTAGGVAQGGGSPTACGLLETPLLEGLEDLVPDLIGVP